MKPTSKTLSWAFVIILLAVGIFTGLGVILMHKQPLVLQGQAEATEIRISGKLPGRIDTFFVQEGDWVHQGDTLVVINSPEVHAKYQQVNALEQVAVQQNKKIDAGTRRQIVATALQLWNKTKSDLTLAQTTYNRILTLYKDSVITSQRKDSSRWLHCKISLSDSTSFFSISSLKRSNWESACRFFFQSSPSNKDITPNIPKAEERITEESLLPSFNIN